VARIVYRVSRLNDRCRSLKVLALEEEFETSNSRKRKEIAGQDGYIGRLFHAWPRSPCSWWSAKPYCDPPAQEEHRISLKSFREPLDKGMAGGFIPPLAFECIKKRSRRHPASSECLRLRASSAINAPGTEGYNITQNSISTAIEFWK
jgi:hypothetical protein